MKDNFSSNSDQYARFRPTYPPEFFDFLNSLLPVKEMAWDCGTGNGQVAHELAKTFDRVFATDISRSQIDNAVQADNIQYSIQPAEQTNFENNSFDLIVIAQAIHWFEFKKFYAEVRRTAREHAVICVVGYGLIKISEQIDLIIANFYENVVGKYWDAERKYIDEAYRTIPFPFSEIQTPSFVNAQEWTLEHLIGFLNTWSAVKHFINQEGYNPVEQVRAEIAELWEREAIKTVHFPIIQRIGR